MFMLLLKSKSPSPVSRADEGIFIDIFYYLKGDDLMDGDPAGSRVYKVLIWKDAITKSK